MEITNKKRIVIIALTIAVLALFAYAIYVNTTAEPDYTGPYASVNARADAIESYLRANLPTLSPVKETMGGTFYVTRMRILNGEGTVEYEDGHNAYTADFTYTVSDDNKQVTVTNFTVRETAPVVPDAPKAEEPAA